MSSNKQDVRRYSLEKFGGSIVTLVAAPLPGLAAEEKWKNASSLSMWQLPALPATTATSKKRSFTGTRMI
jgi:hypothetical protein